MLTNAFVGKQQQPTDADLTATLGPARLAWDRLLSELTQQHGVDVHEWKSYGTKGGWSLRVLRKKRTVVWLSPSPGCFTVLFILGEKAMHAARETKLPLRIVRAMNEAPKYPEGTGVRLIVKSPSEIGSLVKLAAIKLAN